MRWEVYIIDPFYKKGEPGQMYRISALQGVRRFKALLEAMMSGA